MEEDDRESFAGRASADRARLRSAGGILSTGTGAVIAAAVLAALGGWLWHIGVRDAQQVPIVRASNRPVKVRPVDPGGEVTPYQNIGSYDIGAVEETPEPAARLAPPPPEPTAEDVAMGDLKTPEPRPIPETGALILRPAPRPPRPAARAEAPEAADDVRPASSLAPASPGITPPPRPDNLRIRALTARANAEAGDRE